MGKDTIRTTNRAGQYAAAIDAIAKALRQHLHGRGGGLSVLSVHHRRDAQSVVFHFPIEFSRTDRKALHTNCTRHHRNPHEC